jgi:hypothetical protein
MTRVIKSIPVMLDKERNFRLSMRAMKKFEDLTGKSFIKGFSLDTLSMHVFNTLLWCGLVDEDPALKQEELELMWGFADFNELMGYVGEAMRAANPDKKETATPNGSEAGRSSG